METQTLNYNDRSYGNGPSQSNNNNNNEVGNRSEELTENSGRQGLNIDHGFITEIEAYQSLMLDFETEYADFLSAELPKCPNENSNEDERGLEVLDESNRGRRSSNGANSRRSSSVTNSRSSFDGTNGNGSSGGIRYNFDGTISCCDISYDLLVSLRIEQL